jgi:hypothetical protein
LQFRVHADGYAPATIQISQDRRDAAVIILKSI